MRFDATALLIVLSLAAPAIAQDRKLPPTVMTDFDVRRDGMPFGNNGHFTEPDGDCFGMSLLAINLYSHRNDAWRKKEREQEPRIVQRVQDANLRRAAAAAILQFRSSVHDEDRNDRPYVLPAKAGSHFTAALLRMQRTGLPELLGSAEHVTVLYGYKEGGLQIYDPNYPGEVIEWPFDEKNGLGKHPKAWEDVTLYGSQVKVSSTPVTEYATWWEVDRVRAACDALAKECTDFFPTVTAKLEKDAKTKKLLLVGTVTGGRKTTGDGEKARKPERVWIFVNGKEQRSVALDKKGAYRLEVDAALFDKEENDVRVVATVPSEEFGALAGFLETKLAKPPAERETGRGIVPALGD